MARSWVKRTGIFFGLLLLSALLMQFVWYIAEPEASETAPAPEKVNLALRRTADALLREAGDSTSTIPPVEQTGDRVWLLRLERSFNYDRLPEFLQASFEVHGIRSKYDASVLRCTDGVLVLGYAVQDINQGGAAPCSGRTLEPDCYNLQVTFVHGEKPHSPLPWAGWMISAVLAVALFSIGRPRHQAAADVSTPLSDDPDGLHFGHSRLDAANQILYCGGTSRRLTYREAKLLQLFARHPNQVLERSFILENVWADEGILVGRSVDMFVSRLRKLLRDDTSLRLVAVHGVGYRLEVG